MSLDTAFPQQPVAGDDLPLTRKKLRERAAQHTTKQPVEAQATSVLAELFTPHSVTPPATESATVTRPATVEFDVVLPSRRLLRAQQASSVEVVAKAAPRSRAAHGSAVKSQQIRVSSAALAPSGPPRRQAKAFASKAFSGVAMLFAGAILVGVSVPSNAFVDAGTITAAVASEPGAAESGVAALATDSRPTQSLAVSDEVVNEVDRRENIKVISNAEVLAVKSSAGIDYEYYATAGPIRWPFPYVVPTTDKFGDRIGGFHKGTDFAARAGTPIYAIADGIVTLVQVDYSGYGYYVRISHVIDGQQVESLYAHMTSDSSPLVVGDEVKVGDFVGLVGDTGHSFGAHLHLEIHLDEVPVDSFAWLEANIAS